MTVTIPDAMRPQLREGARVSRLAEDEFVAVAIAQALARVIPDPSLEERASRATGEGWKVFLRNAGDSNPKAGDELPG